MKSASENYFVELAKINVADHVERKGQFSYLSWPFAVSKLRQFDPTAIWSVKRFNDLPYLATEAGYFVEVAVTVKDITLSQIHPVLDGKNRPILAPNAFDINTSIQRALVKAIALHGLGLSIYAGEDLPLVEGAEELPAAVPSASVTPLPVSTGREDLVTTAQVRYIRQLMTETHTALQAVLDYFGVDKLEAITKQQASRAIRSLEQTRARAGEQEAA